MSRIGPYFGSSFFNFWLIRVLLSEPIMIFHAANLSLIHLNVPNANMKDFGSRLKLFGRRKSKPKIETRDSAGNRHEASVSIESQTSQVAWDARAAVDEEREDQVDTLQSGLLMFLISSNRQSRVPFSNSNAATQRSESLVYVISGRSKDLTGFTRLSS